MDTTTVRTVQANGLRFGYLEAGEGPLILLLHGFPDTAWSFRPHVEALAESGYRACAVFMRGYAPTEVASDYRLTRLGEDVVALIDALRDGGPRRALVVGHDWGAAATYMGAALAPDRFAGIVTAAIPHLRRFLLRPNGRQLWRSRYMARFQIPGAESRLAQGDALDRLIREWSPDWSYREEDLAPTRELLRDPVLAEAMLAYYRALPRSVPDPRFWRLAGGVIDVPARVIAGLGDGCIGPEMFQGQTHLFGAGLRMELYEGAGHFMHCEQPERFTRSILDTAATLDFD